MSHAALRGVFPQLRRFLDTQSARELTDGMLLERFVARRDEAAFALLVERHGPMVLSVCRRVLRDAHEAEDAFQAAFLVLALRAGAVRRRESLGSWLYGVARRVAAKARAQSARRRGREAPSSAVALAESAEAPELGEFRAVLEEEVGRLPEPYRRPFVLCCLEEKTQEQAAAELGCPRSSLASRLTRARQTLRRRLAERGMAPAALTAAAVRTACTAVHGSGASAGASARVLALAHGAMKTLSATRIVLILFLALFAGAGVVAAGVLARPAPGGAAAGAAPAPKAADEAEAARTDCYGDPLPPGAVMRLGTVRFRHGNGICRVAYSPDGKTLATAGDGGRIRLWDAATGKEIAAFQQGQKTTCVLGLAFSPDGKTLAAAGHNYDSANRKSLPTELMLWDVAEGKARLSFECEHDSFGNLHEFGRLAYSPNGKWLAAATDEKVRLWDAATGKELPSIQAKLQSITALAISSDNHTLAWAGTDGVVVLWDVAAGRELRKLAGHKSIVRELAFAPDGKLLAAGYDDATVGLWDPATGEEVRRLKGHEAPAESVAFAPDGKTLASSGQGVEQVRLWDPATGELQRRLDGPQTLNYVAQVVFSPDGYTLAAAQRDGAVFLWDPQTGKRVAAPDEHELGVIEIDVSPDGRTIATASEDGTIRLWDRATGRRLRTLDYGASVVAVAFSPDGARVTAIGSPRHNAAVPRTWETATGRELTPFHMAEGEYALALDGRVVAVLGPDEVLSLRDPATGKEVHQFKHSSKRVMDVSLSPDGKTLATLDNPEWDGFRYKEGPTVGLWDVATGQELHRIGDVRTKAVAFSPDGRTVALVQVGCVRLWDAAAGVEIRTIEDAGVDRCCFSPDGRVLATVSFTYPTIHLWDVATGGERLRLAGHPDGVGRLAFTPDGRTLISGALDTTALVWDLAPPRPGVREVDRLWSQLADDDPSRAYEAIWALSESRETVDFLKGRLTPASGAEAKEVRRLIADLDSDDYESREKASAELAKHGDEAEFALRKALAGKPSAEVVRRAAALLDALRRRPVRLPAEELQRVRAVEVLERIGTPESRRVLEALAGGGEARLTREAKAALARLDSGR